ncbi:MAG: PIN domain-containing protein [Nanoarchaeota archaeon]
MENGLTYFFDSYALIEIYKGSKNYENYKKARVITSYLHIFEVYYSLIREHNEEEIFDFFKTIKNFCVNLKFEWIPKASKFRQIYKKRDLSYADCLGYIIAKDMGIKFLTGDKEFEDLPNVEFVKKN